MHIIDPEVIEGLKEIGDDEFLIELVDLFLPQSEHLIKEMQEAESEQDSDKMMKASHKLKGSCLNLGAQQLGNICNQIEAKSKVNDLSGINHLLEQIIPVYQQTCTELNKLR